MISVATDREIRRFAPPPAGIGARLQGPSSKALLDPSQIFGLNLTLWLRGSVGVVGSPNVTTWHDQSGNVHDFTHTVGGFPQANPAGINGHPTVDGVIATSTELTHTGAFAWPDLIDAPGKNFTMAWAWLYTGAINADQTFASASILATAENTSRFIAIGAGLDPGNAANAEGDFYLFDAGIASWVPCFPSASGPKGSPHYNIAWVAGGAAVHVNQDAGAFASTAITTFPDMSIGGHTPILLANNEVVSSTWAGPCGEVIVANVAPTAGQITALQNWLHAQWGI